MLNIDVCISTINGVPDQILDEVKKETSGQILISYAKPLVKARVELISKVETPLFLFLDDDIIYPPRHLTVLHNALNGNFFDCIPNTIGAVQGQTVPVGLGERWDTMIQEYIINSSKPRLVKRGGRIMTSNALIKTDLVKDWCPERDVSGCEDLDLTRHIQGKGYSCMVLPYFIGHKRSWGKVQSNGLWYGRGYVNAMGKVESLKQILKLLLGIGKYSLLLLVNPYISYYTVHQNFYTVLGLMRALLESPRYWVR